MLRRALVAPLLVAAVFAVPASGENLLRVMRPPTPQSQQDVVASNNAFACDLYTTLAQSEGNFFFSPFSVSTAVAMSY